MQLGSRWQAGSPPHPGVPELLHPAVAEAERGASARLAGGGSWTLTWLEGRARVELIDATGTLLADLGVTADGSVAARPLADPAGAAGAAGAGGAGGAGASDGDGADGADENDDDDWLS